MLPTPVFLGFPCSLAGKESACNVGDLGWIPRLEDPLETGKATHSSSLVWRIPWTGESMGCKESERFFTITNVNEADSNNDSIDKVEVKTVHWCHCIKTSNIYNTY